MLRDSAARDHARCRTCPLPSFLPDRRAGLPATLVALPVATLRQVCCCAFPLAPILLMAE